MEARGLETEFGTLELVETYLYYDWPRIFAAISNSGQLFIVTWIGEQGSGGHYWLLLPLSLSRLEQVRRGDWELQQAYRSSETGVVYKLHTGVRSIPMRVLEAAGLTADILPAAGERLDEPEPMPKLPFSVRELRFEEAAE